jgi:hypothetical protein
LKSTHFIRKDFSVKMAKTSLYSLLTTGPIVGILAVIYVLIWGVEPISHAFDALLGTPKDFLTNYLFFFGILIIGTVIHELIHAVTWCAAGKKPWSMIKFGFEAKTLTPYTHCRVPMPITAYRTGTWMPGLLTGIIPAVIGLITGDIASFLIGAFFILAAGGDAFILWTLRKVVPTALVQDHPNQAGCYVLEPVKEPEIHSE